MHDRSQGASDSLDNPVNLRTVRQERLLASKLAEFLQSHIEYSIKLLGATEMQHIYKGPSGNFCNIHPVLV